MKHIRGSDPPPTQNEFRLGILIRKLYLGGVHKPPNFWVKFTIEIFRNLFSEEMGGGQGDSDPLIIFHVELS